MGVMLDEKEFEELKNLINNCVCHVIGERGLTPVSPPSSVHSGTSSPEAGVHRRNFIRSVTADGRRTPSRTSSPCTRSPLNDTTSPLANIHITNSEVDDESAKICKMSWRQRVQYK